MTRGVDVVAFRRKEVADARRLLGHVLRYEPDAEVLEPGRARVRARRRGRGMVG